MRKMSKEMDVMRLIAEIKCRPVLWDTGVMELKTKNTSAEWREVAQAVGFDVDQCKRKWKNLRDAYRAEIKRGDRRIQKAKMSGTYDPNVNYGTKWIYFPHLEFIRDIKRPRIHYEMEEEKWNDFILDPQYPSTYRSSAGGSVDDNEIDLTNHPDSMDSSMFYNSQMNNTPDIKIESHSYMDQDMSSSHHRSNVYDDKDTEDYSNVQIADDEDDNDNNLLFEQFQNVVTSKGARVSFASGSSTPAAAVPEKKMQNNSTKTNANKSCDSCSKSPNEQVNFLEDLEKEEQKLMQSTRKDITRANSLLHIGDSDYNFLVSFLPQMKKMSELENLQFRSKMCDLVLKIMAPSIATTTRTSPPALQQQQQQQLQFHDASSSAVSLHHSQLSNFRRIGNKRRSVLESDATSTSCITPD